MSSDHLSADRELINPSLKRVIMPKCLTTAEFIAKANEVHNNVFDYSKVKYVNSHTKVCIICKDHGEFWQIPNSHLCGTKCPHCNGGVKYNTKVFIEKSKLIYGDKFSYDKTNYISSQIDVIITCNKHGDFIHKPNPHLMEKSGGCVHCLKELKYTSSRKLTLEKFIEMARIKHGDRYDYSKVKYVNARTKVSIICPEHGEFIQTPSKHMSGKACNKCVGGVAYTFKNHL